MKRLFKYDGVDLFRMIAALLAVAAHTYPLASISAEANFILVHVVARIAVPFFMMATGYFLLPQYFQQSEQGEHNPPGEDNTQNTQSNRNHQIHCNVHNNHSREPLYRFVKKIGLLYIGATLLYLPVSIYAGFYDGGNALQDFIRNFLIDGTFYHLWYLPAVMLAVLIVYALSLKFSLRTTFSISVVLYLLGVLGDNYFHLIENVPFLHTTYEAAFQIFSYTRNGLFYAPVFLTLGVMVAKQEHPLPKWLNVVGFVSFMLMMLIEGTLLQQYGAPRHTSMYLMLLPCSYFLFGLLKGKHGKRSFLMRDTSLWIYILHPLLIIIIRGGARAIGFTDLLVGNSIAFFICVSILSFACAAAISMRERIISRFATLFQSLFKRKELYRQ